MAINTFPALDIKPSAADGFFLKHFTTIFPAPDVAAQQRLEWDDAIWTARISYVTLNDYRRRLLEVFRNKQKGGFGTFYYGPYRIGYARTGAGGSAPKVKGAGQTGRTLATDGWGANNTTVLKLGDFFSFDAPDGRRYLFQISADATTDGAGEVTLSFEPEMRVSPADNADLDVNDPTCVMALADDEQGHMALRRPFLAGCAFDFIEAAWVA